MINKIIETQKKEVEKQHELAQSERIIAEELREIAERQKHLIQEKQTEIIDSINYAKHIQQALLRDEENTGTHLPEHFILYRPKDIVAGDYYWAAEKSDHWYVAAADCTGHGVPGAMLSMLGMTFLNEIISEDKLLPPAEILNRLRARIIKELRQRGKSGESRDGMDISLLRINLDTKDLEWAGANNSLYFISENLLQEIKADKQPVGYFENAQPFNNHSFKLIPGNCLYLFSDGYADQFSVENKKLMKKRFKELLLQTHEQPLKKQKEFLSDFIDKWKGKTEQTDDVLVIGIRV